ncbi:MAG: type 4a pilus biogenesis protein PilO [Patescibacteria group bacterium]|nr:type 4a pilus biogenesis protein PilO [Patescibacteria group bacterium]
MNNNILTRLTYPSKIALSVLAFLAAAFALFYWLIIPAVNNVETTKVQMQNQRLAAERDYAQGQNLKKIKDDIKAVAPRIGEIEQIFISKSDSLSFVTSLEAAAEKNKVTEKAKLGAETPLGKFYSQIPLRLDVSGNFSGLIGFVTDLETLKKYININSLQITAIGSELPIKTETSTPQKILAAQISAFTYWQGQ